MVPILWRKPTLEEQREERTRRARASIRRAIWYTVLFVIFVYLITHPHLLMRFWR